jgi:LmbE family N-acetylglucosaminyl deacetylase
MIRIAPPPRAASALAIAAHPDDIESWCGGTLAMMAAAGCAVRAVLVTSGDKGSDDPAMTPALIAERREREAGIAAGLLGIAGVEFLRHPDGEVEDTRALRAELVAAIRRWRPDVLFTHDPEQPLSRYLSHRDHRVVGRAALDAVYPLARDIHAYPEHQEAGLAPHRTGAAWLFASAAAACYVDIGAGFDRKIAARLAHESQTPDPGALSASWRERAAAIGAPAGLACAEAFTVLEA